MKNNHKLGAILAILGIVTGLLAFYLIASQYNLLIDAKTVDGRIDEAMSVRITFAVLGWFGTATTAIWMAVLYGFYHKEEWAWFWGTVAATIQLLAGFFPAIPAMDSHMPGPTLIVFALGAVLWFGMLFIGILLMALTGGFTLLGGIGTTCAAVNPTGFGDSMAPLAPFQWLYILFVLTGIAIGVGGIWATVKLVKGMSDSYKMSMQALVSGFVIGGFHIYMSRMLRGKSMPVDAVVYTTVLTLVVFLLYRIPSIWQGVDFEKAKNNKTAGGAAAIILGVLTLTIQYTMGSTHTWGGINYADAFNTAMVLIGSVLILSGIRYLTQLLNIRIIRRVPFLGSYHRHIEPLDLATGN